MEQRKITVVSTRDQIRKTFMSSAKTLGELKSEMTQNGINHEGLTYLEGLTKAEYKDDSSCLPATVTYEDPNTGEEKTTTELVFILSQPNKKIKSGATTRAEAYARIHDMNLEEACKRVYGKNYTQVSTGDLFELIDAHTQKAYTNPGRGNGQNVEEPAAPTEGQENNTPESSTALNAIQAQIVNLKNQIENIKEAIRILTEISSDTDSDDEKNIESLLTKDSSVRTGKPKVEDTGVKSDLPEGMFDDIMNDDWMK